MADCNEFIKAVRQISKETTKAEGPVEISFGKILSASPLRVLVDQKMTLGPTQLVLTRNVTDYEIPVSMTSQNFTLEEEGLESTSLVSAEKQTILVHNALEAGEEVVLLRMQGAQKYIIIDRVVSV